MKCDKRTQDIITQIVFFCMHNIVYVGVVQIQLRLLAYYTIINYQLTSLLTSPVCKCSIKMISVQSLFTQSSSVTPLTVVASIRRPSTTSRLKITNYVISFWSFVTYSYRYGPSVFHSRLKIYLFHKSFPPRKQLVPPPR